MDLSVVVVNYNAGPLLAACVRSVLAGGGGAALEVIVVDNASTDGSLAPLAGLPGVRRIENTANLGFAAAVNQGLRVAGGRLFLLLNPDAELPPETLPAMIAFMDREPRAALAGCRVENPDGSLQRPCRRAIPTPAASLAKLSGLARVFPRAAISRRYELGECAGGQPEPVEAISGSFMFGRRELLERVGGLDERFFLYGEDLDYCLRVAQAGLLVYYVPGARVVHHRGRSRFLTRQRAIRESHRAMRLFYDKHFAAGRGALFNTLVHAAIGLRRRAVQLAAAASSSAAALLMAVGPTARERR